MLSRKLRQKLSELDQKALDPEAKRAEPRQPEKYGPVPIEEAVPGTVTENDFGSFLLWSRPISDIVPNSEEIHSAHSLVFEKAGFAGAPEDYHPDVQSILETEPSQTLYLDIETTGLGTGCAFLIGLLVYESDALVQKQLFARDYAEEPALLAHMAGLFETSGGLVTFNGKSFDFRYLQERFIVNAIPCFPDLAHLDLLHEGRRQWKDVLPNCKLQTLEQHVCGRARHGDIPGEEIPEAYHEFVRSGDARQIVDIIHHNALDLVTMVEVLTCILRGGEV